MLHEAIDQVVVLLQRDELERGFPVDGYNHGLVVATTRIFAQMRLRFTQRDHLHDAW